MAERQPRRKQRVARTGATGTPDAVSHGAQFDFSQFLHACGEPLLQHMDSSMRSIWRLVCKQSCSQVHQHTRKLSGGFGPMHPSQQEPPTTLPAPLLAKCPRVNELWLDGCRLTSMRGVPKALEVLSISTNHVETNWSALCGCTNLVQLRLHNTYFKAAELHRALACMPNLLRLELEGVDTGLLPASRQGMLGSVPKLRHLSIFSPQGDDTVLQRLMPSIGGLTHLTTLKLGGEEEFEAPDCAALASTLDALPGLLEFELSETSSRAAGAAAIAPALSKLQRLQRLSLYSNRFCRGMVQLAPSIGALTDLRSLVLRGNRVGSCDEGVQLLCDSIKRLPRLQELDISMNCLGTQGAIALSHALAGLPLVSLDVSRNNIEVVGAVALAPVIGTLTSLRSLFLGDNDLGDLGVQRLAVDIRGLPHLEVLGLDEQRYEEWEGEGSSEEGEEGEEGEEDGWEGEEGEEGEEEDGDFEVEDADLVESDGVLVSTEDGSEPEAEEGETDEGEQEEAPAQGAGGDRKLRVRGR